MDVRLFVCLLQQNIGYVILCWKMIVDKCIGSKIFPRFIEPLEIRERFFSLRHSAKLKVPGLGYKRILIQVKLSYVFFSIGHLIKVFQGQKDTLSLHCVRT